MNIVEEILKTALTLEIENQFEIIDNKIIVYLQDGTKALIKFKKPKKVKNDYINNYDFGYGKENGIFKKLLLRDNNDLNAYVKNLLYEMLFSDYNEVKIYNYK